MSYNLPTDPMTDSEIDPKDSELSSMDELALIRKNWERYEYAKSRGHYDYCRRNKRCEDFYIGGGRQWSQADRDAVEELGRPIYEINELKKAVDAAIGYQIHNRMDISFRPTGGKADAELAEIHTKVVKQIATRNNLSFKETQVFGDGLIGGRGYFDVRMCYENTIYGEVKITVPDPMDIIPDPDAKEYDPDEWQDVQGLRWMTEDEICQTYGEHLRSKLRNSSAHNGEADFGADDLSAPRNRFGNSWNDYTYDGSLADSPELRRYRVIDRQWRSFELCQVAIFNENDLQVVDGLPPEKLAELKDQGAIFTKRMMNRIRWTVTTYNCLLANTVSPFQFFTVVPFFCTFRRGYTAGIIENAMDAQEILNKAVSQYLHIIGTTANSGWLIEKGSLTNMDVEELETLGSQTGVVIEYQNGSTKPEKIRPNEVPQGIHELIAMASAKLKEITVPDVAQGQSEGPEISGIAIQTKQYAAQKQMAIQLDNLGRTRNLLAGRIHSLVQRFYDYPTIMRITKQDPRTGRDIEEQIPLNQDHPEDAQAIVNDLTVGTYDVIISEQPMTASFGNSQFEQAVEMKQAGVPIPDSFIIKYSMLADKYDIMEQISKATAAAPDPLMEARINLINQQAELAKAQVVESAMDTMFSSLNTAAVIAGNPATAPLADQLNKSAGFVDKNAAPIIPEMPLSAAVARMPQAVGQPAGSAPGALPPGVDRNTHPGFPPNPEQADAGLLAGQQIAGQRLTQH